MELINENYEKLGGPPPALNIPKPALPAGEKGYKRLKKANERNIGEAPRVGDVMQLGAALFDDYGAEADANRENGPSTKPSKKHYKND